MLIVRRLALSALACAALLATACAGDNAPDARQPAATPGAAAAPGVTRADTPGLARQLGTLSGVATTAKAPNFTPLPGARAYFGQLGPAAYQIEMPEQWNGSVVLYAHGFAGFGTEVAVQFPPAALRNAIIRQGYAWAASSYSENGYTPGIGADDTLALKRYFAGEFGEPKLTYIAGLSMGGNVAALSLEYFAGEYDGGLSFCGAVAGQEQIDYLLSWTALAEFTSGISFTAPENASNLGTVLLRELPQKLGTPAAPTPAGMQFASAVRNLSGGPRPFFAEGFQEQYVANFGLVLADPQRRSLTGRASTNEGVTYDVDDALGLTDDALNAGVPRYAAAPDARNAEAHPDAVPTSGRISDPFLTIHGTGDLFVPISQEQSYRRKVEEAGKGDLLVQRAIRAPGHCRFSEAEYAAAFTDLVGWVEKGTKPAGEDLLADLSDAGRQFTSPLRPGDPGTK